MTPIYVVLFQTVNNLISVHGKPDECVELPVHFWGFTDCQAVVVVLIVVQSSYVHVECLAILAWVNQMQLARCPI